MFSEEQIKPGLAPMEAKLVDALPDEPGWQFEPKWDGFRCLAFRARKAVALSSKSGKPLNRFFPEVVDMLVRIGTDRLGARRRADHSARRCAVVRRAAGAAASGREPRPQARRRDAGPVHAVRSACDSPRTPLHEQPLSERRAALEEIYRAGECSPVCRCLAGHARSGRSPRAGCAIAAARSTASSPSASTGPYTPGERSMLKVKQRRTADCVVGGFRYDQARAVQVASLLLGLYDDAGPAQSRRLHLGDRQRRSAGADQPGSKR